MMTAGLATAFPPGGRAAIWAAAAVLLLAAALVMTASAAHADSDDFVTTWRTTVPGESITIPVAGARGTYTIHWGDGTVSADVTGRQTHAYATPGNHTVRISGDFTRIYLDDQQPNASKLVSIDQWGSVSWTTMEGAFEGAANMVYRATDVPDLSRVGDMQAMFRGASSFDGDLSGWDVSGVAYMDWTFAEASSFNGDVSTWDVSNVEWMGSMFFAASSFNGNISKWDVSSVHAMHTVFFAAHSFNGDISGWDVSSATDTWGMFQDAHSFNQDISAWDVSWRDQHGLACSTSAALLQPGHIRLGRLLGDRHVPHVRRRPLLRREHLGMGRLGCRRHRRGVREGQLPLPVPAGLRPEPRGGGISCWMTTPSTAATRRGRSAGYPPRAGPSTGTTPRTG